MNDMKAKKAMIFQCGSSRGKCICKCPNGPCDHTFDKVVEVKDEKGNVIGGSTVCTKCGMDYIDHALWVLP